MHIKLPRKQNKIFDIAIYTNGTILSKDTILWANDNNVAFVVSLDGPPVDNDAIRTLKNGAGSSAVVLRNIRLLMEWTRFRWRRVNAVASQRM